MKHLIKLCVLLAIATTVVMVLSVPKDPRGSYYMPQAAAATSPGGGMAGSPHDFSGQTVTATGYSSHSGTYSGYSTTVTTGMCTYCHTPHHALSTLLLWNQTLSTAEYSWDVPETTSGTKFPTFTGNTYMGPTAKCLSCHDGTVAVGDFNLFEGKGVSQGGVVSSATDYIAGNFQIAGDQQFNSIQQPNGSAGNFAGNHPVAMPYPLSQTPNTYNTVTNGSPGAGFVSTEWVSNPAAVGIALYNDDGSQHITSGAVSGKTGIECSSCHDVHNDSGVQDNYLVLGKLSGNSSTGASAYICLKCHIK